jgi:hypothetical protein
MAAGEFETHLSPSPSRHRKPWIVDGVCASAVAPAPFGPNYCDSPALHLTDGQTVLQYYSLEGSSEWTYIVSRTVVQSFLNIRGRVVYPANGRGWRDSWVQ